MTRLLKTLLISLALSLAARAVRAQSVLFGDDFNSGGSGYDASKWKVTSGALRTVDGAAATASSVFRVVTQRTDFGDVDVSFRLQDRRLTTSSGESWHGVHVFLRYQSEFHLYALSVNRRDNKIVIKKKVPGGPSNGGTYYDLTPMTSHPVPYGSWQNVRATAKNNADGSVSIRLYADGVLLLDALDRGAGGPPIRSPGRTGVRSDYADIRFDDFVVRPYGDGGGEPEPPTAAVPKPPAAPEPAPSSTGLLFGDDFNQKGGGYDTSKWKVTSGALRLVDGAAATASSVFRVVTQRTDFRDVEVSFRLLDRRLTSSSGEGWHGVHVFLRYQSEFNLYALSINRRDNKVIIKKKVPGGPSNGGTYYDLTPPISYAVPYDAWQVVRAAAVNNSDGSVSLKLYADGRLLASATDRGAGGAPIRDPGRTGVRSDYADIRLDDFQVASAAAGSSSEPEPAPAPVAPPPAANANVAKSPSKFLSPARADGVNDVAVFGLKAQEVSIFDVKGRQVFQGSRQGGPIVWDCRDSSGRIVESGVYIAKIHREEGETEYQSFAIVK